MPPLKSTYALHLQNPKKMKVGELKAACKEHGISKGNKAEMAAALVEVVQRAECESSLMKHSIAELKAALSHNPAITIRPSISDKGSTLLQEISMCLQRSL